MTETIMPAFIDSGPHAAEGRIIGRLLAGYGELEFLLASCVKSVLDDLDRAIKLMFSERGERARLKRASKEIRNAFGAIGLGTPFDETMTDLHWCREIRNQYAHCNWYNTNHEGLAFINLEEIAQLSERIGYFREHRHFITLPLLMKQEAFFKNVERRLMFLESEFLQLTGKPVHQLWSGIQGWNNLPNTPERQKK